MKIKMRNCKFILSVLFLVFVFIQWTSAAKILVLHPSPSKSHLIVARALTNELARRGHEITMFSQFPLSKPMKNLRDIKVEVNQTLDLLTNKFVEESGKSSAVFKNIPILMSISAEGAEATLNHPEFIRMRKEEKFDLVIVGMFTTHFMFGAAGYFNCPQIGVWSAGTFTGINMVVGNPYSPEAVPHMQTKFSGKMSFIERVQNFMMYGVDVAMMAAFNYYQNKVYKRNFPNENFMSYDEAKSNVSLILINSHFSQEPTRPFVPNLIEVGGLQIKATPSPLPKHIQEWIDGAEHGVIYFSLGSNIKSNLLPPEKIDILMKTFAKLKERVIFKWESKGLPGQPKNVLTDTWLPQDDILANPKVKLFISHCGLGGVAESKFHAVPIICIPIFADQMTNAAAIKNEGWGLSAPLETISEEELTKVVREILSNPKYKNTVKGIADLFRDRPQSALDTAVFWTEYVIRHHGAPHMHYPAADLNFIQRNSLDVIALIFTVLYIFAKIVAFIFRFIKRSLCKLYRFVVGPAKTTQQKKKN